MSYRKILASAALVLASQGCRGQPSEATKSAPPAPPARSPAAPPVSSSPPPPSPSPAPSGGAARLEAPLHLPERAPSGAKVPLLVMLHSLGSSSEAIERFSDWPAFAEQSGIAWAAPNGPFDQRGRRFWNAGESCCNFDQLPVDHVGELSELIERLASDPRIDRARVYVGGYSNGGFMAHRLACERPALLAGIVSIAGAGPLRDSGCKAPSSLRVLQVQGDADPIVTYGGGHLFQDARLPEHASAQQTARDWAKRLGCGAPQQLEPIDFESALPDKETRVSSYEGCSRGKLALWTVTGGGHMVGLRAPAPSVIWSYLER